MGRVRQVKKKKQQEASKGSQGLIAGFITLAPMFSEISENLHKGNVLRVNELVETVLVNLIVQTSYVRGSVEELFTECKKAKNTPIDKAATYRKFLELLSELSIPLLTDKIDPVKVNGMINDIYRKIAKETVELFLRVNPGYTAEKFIEEFYDRGDSSDDRNAEGEELPTTRRGLPAYLGQEHNRALAEMERRARDEQERKSRTMGNGPGGGLRSTFSPFRGRQGVRDTHEGRTTI